MYWELKKKYSFTIVVWTEGETGTVRLKNEAYFSKHLELLCVPPHLQEHCSCVRLPGELQGPLLCISVTPCRNYHWSPERLSLKNRKISLSLVRRLTQTYLKYHNPGVANVVKVDGTLVRVGVAGAAHVVVLVPVHTHATDIELLPD